jgi:curved DNA-binding protein
MSDPKGYYSLLGIHPSATASEIKKAYRRLSLITHPDRKPNDPKAQTKFQALNEAHDVLSNPEKRRAYDMNISEEEVNIEDIFEMFKATSFMMPPGMMPRGMSMGAMPPGMTMPEVHIFQSPIEMLGLPKKAHIMREVSITLAQAFTGCQIPLELERTLPGGICEVETVYVTIPQGIDDNEVIVLPLKGNIMSEKLKGDVKVTIKLIGNSCFKRDGLDLIYAQTISLKEALCGFTFELNHIDGRTFHIENKKGTLITPGYRKHVPDMGMIRDRHTGSLIIEFTVDFPKKLTDEQIQQIHDILT